MNRYSISQISKKLDISKDTLRYYDKIKLISPLRSENQYRYYTEDDLMNLIYIQVMKFAGFSLDDIKRVIENKNNIDHTSDCMVDTIRLLEEKKEQTIVQIEVLQKILELISISIEVIKGKKMNNPDAVNELISSLYKDIKNADLIK